MRGGVVIVPGCPVPCGRPRSTLAGHVYMPERTRKFERLVRRMTAAVFDAPLEGPVSLHLTFVLPDRRRRDIDNLAKSIMDGMNGVAFVDDSQVVFHEAQKVVDKSCCCTIACVRPVTAWAPLWKSVQDVCASNEGD